jgi:hypothetical protein
MIRAVATINFSAKSGKLTSQTKKKNQYFKLNRIARNGGCFKKIIWPLRRLDGKF